MKSKKEWIKFTNYEKAFSADIINYCKEKKIEYTLEEIETKDIFHFKVGKRQLDNLKLFIDFCPRIG